MEVSDSSFKKGGKRELKEETTYDCSEDDLRLLVRDNYVGSCPVNVV